MLIFVGMAKQFLLKLCKRKQSNESTKSVSNGSTKAGTLQIWFLHSLETMTHTWTQLFFQLSQTIQFFQFHVTETQRNFILLRPIILWKGRGLKGRGTTDGESECTIFKCIL